MHRRSLLLAATALLAAGAFAQPRPRRLRRSRRRRPRRDKKADPLQPQKAEQEPRPVSQELQKQAIQGGPGAPTAAPADPKKWDVVGAPRPRPRRADRHPHRHLDVARRLARRPRDRVRPARRHLCDADRRRRGAGARPAAMRGTCSRAIRPSGTEIAFTSDRGGGDNIWVMGRDGSDPRAITKEKFRLLNQPEWTPDGAFVVARKHFTGTRSLGRRRDVALPPLRRERGRADDQGAHQAEGHQRAGLLARRPLPLFLRRRDAGRDLRISARTPTARST